MFEVDNPSSRVTAATSSSSEYSNGNTLEGRLLLNPVTSPFVITQEMVAANSAALDPRTAHDATTTAAAIGSANEPVGTPPAAPLLVAVSSSKQLTSPDPPLPRGSPQEGSVQPTVLSVIVPPRHRNKGVLCKQYLADKGSCSRGHDCPFLHVLRGDTRPLPDSVCTFFRSSSCLRDTCRFFHGSAERLAHLRFLGHTTYRLEDELEARTPPPQISLETTTIVGPGMPKAQSSSSLHATTSPMVNISTTSFAPLSPPQLPHPHCQQQHRLSVANWPPQQQQQQQSLMMSRRCSSISSSSSSAAIPLPPSHAAAATPSTSNLSHPHFMFPVVAAGPAVANGSLAGNTWVPQPQQHHQSIVMPQCLLTQPLQQQQIASIQSVHHQQQQQLSLGPPLPASFVTAPPGGVATFELPHDALSRFPLHHLHDPQQQQQQQWHTATAYSLASPPPPSGGVLYSVVAPPYVQNPVPAHSSAGGPMLTNANVFAFPQAAALQHPQQAVRGPNTLGWYAHIM